MGGFGGLGIFFVLIAGFCIFLIVLMFKALQFTLTATNLYKKILSREDLIIKLLIDIRDGTKSFKLGEIEKSESTLDIELDSSSQVPAKEEKAPACPVCKGNNTYFDFENKLFCRNCMKITGIKKST